MGNNILMSSILVNFPNFFVSRKLIYLLHHAQFPKFLRSILKTQTAKKLIPAKIDVREYVVKVVIVLVHHKNLILW